MRLPLEVIQTLAREVYQKIADPIDAEERHRWHGHRVLLMDATSFSMPDTPELQALSASRAGRKRVRVSRRPSADAVQRPHRTGGRRHHRPAADPRDVSGVGHAPAHGPGGSGRRRRQLWNLCSSGPAANAGCTGCSRRITMRIVDFTPHRPCIEPGK